MGDFLIWLIEAVILAFSEIQHLHFHNTYDHQDWTAVTFREIDLLEANQIGTDDTITIRSSDFKKTFKKSYGHQIEIAGLVRGAN